ncbi:40S ribosomal protein, partial [Rhizopus stolonifer]
TPADFDMKILSHCKAKNNSRVYLLSISAKATGISPIKGIEKDAITFNLALEPLYVGFLFYNVYKIVIAIIIVLGLGLFIVIPRVKHFIKAKNPHERQRLESSMYKIFRFELGRPSASTKLGGKRIHLVRVRGGNYKHRALRLDSGNFSWGSEGISRKTRLLTVNYNASNNELVRTNTLVKGAVIQIDATPFRQWYESHYAISLAKKKAEE